MKQPCAIKSKPSLRNINILLIILLSCLFLGQGCPLLESILGDLLNTVDEESEENETFVVVVVDFQPRDDCDPEEDWFCESTIKDKVGKAIIDGVREANKKNSKISYGGRITGADSKAVYAILRTKGQTPEKKKSQLKFILNQTNGNTLLFGKYTGDDHRMKLKPTMFIAGRNAISKNEWVSFGRKDTQQELFRKVSTVIRNMLLDIFNQ